MEVFQDYLSTEKTKIKLCPTQKGLASQPGENKKQKNKQTKKSQPKQHGIRLAALGFLLGAPRGAPLPFPR